jgi:hypothetical protein
MPYNGLGRKNKTKCKEEREFDMKKRFCGLLFALVAAGILCGSAYGAGNVVASGVGEDGLSWVLDGDGVLTVSGSGPMTNYYVADSIWSNWETVLPGWEPYSDQIKEVVVEQGVTSIGNIAFADLYNLEKVTLADSVTNIEWFAFGNDISLTEIDLGNGRVSISDEILYDVGITELNLPATLQNISIDGLSSLYQLENFQVDAANPYYSSVDGVLYSKDGSELVKYPMGRQDQCYTVPDTVTKIGENAFCEAEFQAVILPQGLESIGWYAFSYCENLTSVVIPDGVTSLGKEAFQECTSLETAEIPDSVDSLDDVFPSQTKLIFSEHTSWHAMEDGSYTKGVSVATQGKECYSYAFQVLDIVNKERVAEGLDPLTMDESLLETAMQRAMETTLYWSHTRPCGLLCFSASDLMYGENIAMGYTTPQDVMTGWMNSSGHRANILDCDYTTIGVGCVYADGFYYWVQCFGLDDGTAAKSTDYADKTNTRTVVVSQDEGYYSAQFQLSSQTLKVGGKAQASVVWNETISEPFSGITMTSSDTSVCRIEGSQVVAVGAGTAKITMYYDGYPEGGTTILVSVVDPTVSTGFSDVPSDTWYSNAVIWAVNNGITDGVGEGKFAPNKTCTRGQIVTFLWRAAGKPEPETTTNPFTDVSGRDYYYKAVLWAYENGITTGATATTFNPNGSCTRAQIVTFLWRYEGKPSAASTGEFYDVESDAYYSSAVYWAAAGGITTGMSKTIFAPDSTCTRAQAVTFLHRATL